MKEFFDLLSNPTKEGIQRLETKVAINNALRTCSGKEWKEHRLYWCWEVEKELERLTRKEGKTLEAANWRIAWASTVVAFDSFDGKHHTTMALHYTDVDFLEPIAEDLINQGLMVLKNDFPKWRDEQIEMQRQRAKELYDFLEGKGLLDQKDLEPLIAATKEWTKEHNPVEL